MRDLCAPVTLLLLALPRGPHELQLRGAALAVGPVVAVAPSAVVAAAPLPGARAAPRARVARGVAARALVASTTPA